MMSDKARHLMYGIRPEELSAHCVKFGDGRICWYNDLDEIHREDGPAVLHPDPMWCLNGMLYSFEDWCDRLGKTEADKMLLRLQYI